MAISYTDAQYQVPDWLKPYVFGYDPTKKQGEEGYYTDIDPTTGEPLGGLLGRAMAMGSSDMPLYDISPEAAKSSVANRIAGMDPMQERAIQDLASMQPSAYTGQGAGLMGLAGTGTYDTATAQRYMDPYMQQVVDQQKKSAIADYARQMPSLTSSAYGVGAGRGTRSALMQSEANRNLQNNLQNIQAQGLQNAWQQGQGQFNTEANRMMAAGQGLIGAGAQDYTQMTGINAAQQQGGAARQNLAQNQLNTAYENYLEQQRRPFEKLGWMSDILSGMPTSGYSSRMFTPAARPDVAGQSSAATTTGLGYLGSLG